jgi:hypothetical protein
MGRPRSSSMSLCGEATAFAPAAMARKPSPLRRRTRTSTDCGPSPPEAPGGDRRPDRPHEETGTHRVLFHNSGLLAFDGRPPGRTSIRTASRFLFSIIRCCTASVKFAEEMKTLHRSTTRHLPAPGRDVADRPRLSSDPGGEFTLLGGRRGHSATFTPSVTLFAPGPLFLTKSLSVPSFFGVNFTSHFGPGLVSLPTSLSPS